MKQNILAAPLFVAGLLRMRVEISKDSFEAV